MSFSKLKLLSRLRSLFWPIERNECKIFFPMLAIYTLIVFNYSLLRIAKDALVVTAPFSGADTIPFIKVWAILPMALLITFVFTRLSNNFRREHVFYIMLSAFLIFFFVFAFVLYPLRDSLHFNTFANKLELILPKGLHGFVSIVRNWTFTLFYVMSELWGTAIMTVLFWGFANDITRVGQAKRFYAILGLGANLATILSGKVSILLAELPPFTSRFLNTDKWGHSIASVTLLVLFSGLLAMGIFRLMHSRILHKRSSDLFCYKTPSSIKMGMRKNFAYLARSKYLLAIAVIVLAYNIALNMVEIVWKDQMRLLFPGSLEYSAYMGKVQMAMGALSTIIALFICGQVMRRFSWTTAALITPIALLGSGILFFSFVLASGSFTAPIAAFFGTTPLILTVFFGSMQNCLSRGCKYTLFDATKELAFVPLSPESKLKGKAAIDGVGSRLGKSGGSLIHEGLLMLFGTIALSTPYVACLLLFVIIAWIVATRSLGKKFEEIIKPKEEPSLDSPTLEKALEKKPKKEEPVLTGAPH